MATQVGFFFECKGVSAKEMMGGHEGITSLDRSEGGLPCKGEIGEQTYPAAASEHDSSTVTLSLSHTRIHTRTHIRRTNSQRAVPAVVGNCYPRAHSRLEKKIA